MRCLAAILASLLALAPAAAPAQGDWHLVGQLEAPPGARFGPLTLSPMGELVAGTLWDGAEGFEGRVWTLDDGLAIARLEGGFASLLPIRFAQRAYDPRTMEAQVYAHSRRELRAWGLAGGAPALVLPLDPDMLARDALFDGFRQSYLVAGDIGPLQVHAADGAPIGRIETDALRPHGPMWLSADGQQLVVASAGFTLTGSMAGIPYDCAQADCAAAYADFPASYGPYEEFLAYDPRHQRLATLAPIDAEAVAQGSAGGNFWPVAEPVVRLWTGLADWRGETPPERALEGFATPVRYGEFSQDGVRLLTLETGGALAVWEVASGRRELALEGVVTAHFIPGGKSLFLHRTDGSSVIASLGQGAVLQELPGPAVEALIGLDGRTLITYAPGEGPARLWRRR